MTVIHPSAQFFGLPPDEGARPSPPSGTRRVNLRALAARPARFEHHLVVVARVGATQLELVTATEPLSFAHENFTDEFVVGLPTGDSLLDAFPFRVFLSDPESGEDVGRVRHRAGDLVAHPAKLLHWPGRLRAPFTPPEFPGGTRRAVLSCVFCGSGPSDAPSAIDPRVAPGREADVKAYTDPPPSFVLDELTLPDGEAARVVASIDGVSWTLQRAPFSPPRGGYVLVMDAEEGGPAWPGDLVFVPSGAGYDGEGVTRALVLASDAHDAEPPPPAWDACPPPPFPVHEAGAPSPLPLTVGGLSVEAIDDATVAVRVAGPSDAASVPRHWLARLLYRVALHTLLDDDGPRPTPRAALGFVETYGGFRYDDRGGRFRLGVREAGMVEVAPEDLAATLEALYRAVAPPGYVERI